MGAVDRFWVPDLGVLAGSPSDSAASKTQSTRIMGRDNGCGQQQPGARAMSKCSHVKGCEMRCGAK
jgi:hypothetical protein